MSCASSKQRSESSYVAEARRYSRSVLFDALMWAAERTLAALASDTRVSLLGNNWIACEKGAGGRKHSPNRRWKIDLAKVLGVGTAPVWGTTHSQKLFSATCILTLCSLHTERGLANDYLTCRNRAVSQTVRNSLIEELSAVLETLLSTIMDSPPEPFKDYKQMWSEAIKEYSKAVGDKHEHDFYKEIEANFKTKQDSTPQQISAKVANAFWSAAPDAVNFAGQVAALSFPPAAIIATVANLFVSACKKYHELFSSMDGLRSQIQFYFEQMKLREEHELKCQAFEPLLKQYDFLRLCSYLKICGFIMRYSKQADRHKDDTNTALKSRNEVK
ncbi:hypothetical protein IWX90DRAFT_417277 [Phyllosticta citrichinensis]|uniref:Fungal STAND N-terminal Goodbye domain-containing protein n=1 Tax=Phyllosticta citrichinensis TaxID=1130410 RepID=A0ABR1XKJ4_9PEZI